VGFGMKMVLNVALGQLTDKKICSAMAGQSACWKSDLHRLLITFWLLSVVAIGQRPHFFYLVD